MGPPGEDGSVEEPVLRGVLGPSVLTRILGNTGQAGPDFTLQRLTADGNLNTTTSAFDANALQMSTAIDVGVYYFEYTVFYTTAALTTGIALVLTFTGTASFEMNWWYQIGTGTTATTGIGDDQNISGVGQILEGYSNSDGLGGDGFGAVKVSVGVASTTSPIMAKIVGVCQITVRGNLELRVASEVAASGVRTKARTFLNLTKL